MLSKIDAMPKANRRGSIDRSKGQMLTQTKRLLTEFYTPFNRKLSKLLNDDRFLFNDNNGQSL